MTSQQNVDYAVVKKPNQDRELTFHEQNEWMRCAVDPMYFFTNYCYVTGTRGKTLFEPRSYQSDILDVILGGNFSCINAPRQCGKTTTLGLIALHNTIFTEAFNVGITSFKLTNCKDFMDRIKFTYENLDDFLKPPVILYNASTITFTNRSTIYTQVTSGDALRGKTNHMAIVDEFAFCSPLVADEFYTSLLPSLTADGAESTSKVIFISTPNGSSGKYAEIAFGAMAKGNGFDYLQVDHTKIPNRTEEFRKSMIEKLGYNKYAQEYEGAFLSDSGTLVNSRVLEAIKTDEPVFVNGDWSFFVPESSLTGRTLAMACDISEGIGKDNHAVQVLDVNTFEQVAEFANNVMNQSQYVKDVIRMINVLYQSGVEELYFTSENNGIGNGFLRLIEHSEDSALAQTTMINEVDKYGAPTGRNGLLTTAKSKAAGCAQLKDMIESGKLKVNSEQLVVELKFFIKKGNSFAAEAGAKDDRVMAMVLLMNMLEQLSNYEDSVYEAVNEVSIDDETWGMVF